MKALRSGVLSLCFLWILLAGCGGNSKPSTLSKGNNCSGSVLSGTLRDSLTSQPVTQGTATLESGTELGTTPLFNFSPSQTVATNANGEFSLCAQAISYPSVLVLEAMDSSGRAYPPYVAPVTAAAALGNISMGGCTLVCGLAGEQQTATPATIAGQITSTPASVSGTVTPQFAIRRWMGRSHQMAHRICGLWRCRCSPRLLPLSSAQPRGRAAE